MNEGCKFSLCRLISGLGDEDKYQECKLVYALKLVKPLNEKNPSYIAMDQLPK